MSYRELIHQWNETKGGEKTKQNKNFLKKKGARRKKKQQKEMEKLKQLIPISKSKKIKSESKTTGK